MSRFVATSDYQVIEREALVFVLGEEVLVDVTDKGWPGWVWVKKEGGRGGYVPASLLEGGPVEAGARLRFVRDFDARDLSVTKGATLTSLREIEGWHWCRADDGSEGWVAGYLLRAE